MPVMPQANRLKLPTTSSRQQQDGRTVWNESRSATTADFFTLGYTGRTIEELLNTLTDNSVRTLADIRQNPVSMYRPELSKSNLRRLVEERGMQYVHLPQLGVPRDIRAKAIETGTRDTIWDWYDQYVVASYMGRNLHIFLNSVEHPVALMCVEIDPRQCHRHRLFLALEEWGLKGFDL
jgi:uncharacterized protein (DUF488 family)